MIIAMLRLSSLGFQLLVSALLLCSISPKALAFADPDARVPALKVGTGYGVGGLVLWLAADSGVKTNESGVVRGIVDKTKNFVLVPDDLELAPTLVPKGLNDLPVLHFDGTQYLTSTDGFGHALDRDMTFVFVGLTAITSDRREPFALYLGQNRRVGANRALVCLKGKYFFDGQYLGFHGFAAIKNSFQIVIVSIDSNLKQATFWEKTKALPGIYDTFGNDSIKFMPLSDGVTLGAAAGGLALWKGDIAEAMVFDHALTPEEAQKVATSLATKYHLP